MHQKILIGGLRSVGYRGKIFLDKSHDCTVYPDRNGEIRCEVCFGIYAENTLATCCPGIKLSTDQRRLLANGDADYREWGWDLKRVKVS